MVRFKNRYFVIEVNLPGKSKDVPLILKPFSFHNTICQVIQQMHGDFGTASVKSGFTTKYCNEKTKIALIKVRHGPHKILQSCLPLVDQIEGKVVKLKTLYIGASMKQCFEYLQKHQRKKLNQVWATLKTDEERKSYEAALLNYNVDDDVDIL